MIVYDLECRTAGHRFEGWFGSSVDFSSQQARGFVCCPQCGSSDIIKAPMAPNLSRKGNQMVVKAPPQSAISAGQTPANASLAAAPAETMSGGPMPPEAVKMLKAMAQMQAEAIKHSRWVGDRFAEKSRAMHYGECDLESIHGHATPEDAKALIDEGISIAPLPFPVIAPSEFN